MQEARLVRVESGDNSTFGVLSFEGVPVCVTVERAWKDNAANISCIPIGTYRVAKTNSHHFGLTWEIKDVPERSHILMHKGNVATDSKGCVVVGSTFGELGSVPAVLSSGAAFKKLEKILPDEFMLEVVKS